MKTCRFDGAANISLAAFPGMRHEVACEYAMGLSLSEPCFGAISTAHVQLVPQSFGVLTHELCEGLRQAHPDVRFRLHANVRVLRQHVRADLSGFAMHRDWFEQAARVSKRLGATAYSAHAGRRSEATVEELLENVRRAADLFGHAVAVEGLYPSGAEALLISTWDEYRQLFDSMVPYALDLSHLNIVATQSGVRELTLVQEMLACERCLEIHVSDNDGRGDSHRVCDVPPWWFDLLDGRHPHAVVFSEGNHSRRLA